MLACRFLPGLFVVFGECGERFAVVVRAPAAAPQEGIVRYAILIYDENTADPAAAPPTPPEAWDQVMADYTAYSDMLRAGGHHVAAEALQPVTTATTVRVRDGQTLTTDGPFAETKEALGGFYLVEAADLDEALRLAAACPGAKFGSIEVRPVVDFEAADVAGQFS